MQPNQTTQPAESKATRANRRKNPTQDTPALRCATETKNKSAFQEKIALGIHTDQNKYPVKVNMAPRAPTDELYSIYKAKNHIQIRISTQFRAVKPLRAPR